MYADDTNICHHSKDISKLCETINKDLEQLDQWLRGNKLSLNVSKTYSMLIGSKPRLRSLNNSSKNLELKIRTSRLEVVNKTKYLGVIIDNSLDWKEHIKIIVSKVSRAIGLLKHTKNILPMSSLRTLYSGIIEPHFRYCCSVWGCCGVTEIAILQRLQNRAARIVTNSNYDVPSEPLIELLKWKPIKKLINEESQMMVYKSLNNLSPQDLSDLFVRNSSKMSYNLRNTNTDLVVPMKKQSLGQKCFSYRGAKIWNGLTDEAKQATSLRAFKKSL